MLQIILCDFWLVNLIQTLKHYPGSNDFIHLPIVMTQLTFKVVTDRNINIFYISIKVWRSIHLGIAWIPNVIILGSI